MRIGRSLYRAWTVVLGALVVLQFALAGYGAFSIDEKIGDDRATLTHLQFDNAWSYHAGFGFAVLLGGLLLVVFALVGRVGRTWTLLTIGLLALLVVQVVLAEAGANAPFIGALHAFNGVVIFAVTAFIARGAWLAPSPAA